MNLYKIFLFPFSILYGIVVKLRNILFDIGALKSEEPPIKIISVGNLTTGGTGKTPLVEYLVQLLYKEKSIAILSRGYGRATKGLIKATNALLVKDIGDEPMQYFKKFKDIAVFVDENRRRGINHILKDEPETDIVFLDDAFQHRYIKAGLSILLTDYHNLYCDDYLLPTGSLREHKSGAKRANIIVVTKTPRVLSPYIRKDIINLLKPSLNQSIYFSYINYGDIKSLWRPEDKFTKKWHFSKILIFAGIANTYPLEEYLKNFCYELETIKYADHHNYTAKDIEYIKRIFDDIYIKNKLLITTEKDAMRLLHSDLKGIAMQLPIYYIPIEATFHAKDKDNFENEIINYVNEN